MVSIGHLFAAHHEQILNPEHVRRKEVALKSHLVSIPTIDMDHGFDALLLQQVPPRQGRSSS